MLFQYPPDGFSTTVQSAADVLEPCTTVSSGLSQFIPVDSSSVAGPQSLNSANPAPPPMPVTQVPAAFGSSAHEVIPTSALSSVAWVVLFFSRKVLKQSPVPQQ